MEKISCEVIRDLLPLYCDDVCSQDSCKLVENHLKDCQNCCTLLEKMKTECRLSNEQEQCHEEIVKDMASVWRKSVIKSFVKGILVASCVCLLLIGGYWGLTRWANTVVPNAHIEVIVENVTDESMTIHLEAMDGKKVYSCSTSVTEDGKLFICAKRGIIGVENGNGEKWAADFTVPRIKTTKQGGKVQINEVYYGVEGEYVLIWQE